MQTIQQQATQKHAGNGWPWLIYDGHAWSATAMRTPAMHAQRAMAAAMASIGRSGMIGHVRSWMAGRAHDVHGRGHGHIYACRGRHWPAMTVHAWAAMAGHLRSGVSSAPMCVRLGPMVEA